MQTTVLLSVKPRFADAILSGRKVFEFRRAVFRRPGVCKVVLYASSPVQRVVGEFYVEDILAMKPRALWAATKDGSGIDKEYFDTYFEGRRTAYALKVRAARRYPRPLELGQHFGISRPPQSFCYL